MKMISTKPPAMMPIDSRATATMSSNSLAYPIMARFNIWLASAFLLVSCTGHTALSTSATTYDGTYPVTLRFITAPSGLEERCDARVERTLIVEHGTTHMTWTQAPTTDLTGAVNSTGIAHASTSHQGQQASFTVKLDPKRHSATGVFDGNGCIYAVKPRV